MQNFRNLEIYQRTEELTTNIYLTTQHFPREEIYNLTQHMRKTILSVGANIAEGSVRQSDAEFSRFLHIAFGSLKELEHFLNIANKLGYLTKEENNIFLNKTTILSKMINKFIKSIKSKS